MATYINYNPESYNDFMTPDYVWDWLEPYIPRDKVIWEPFYGDGTSGDYLKSKGYDIIHENEDFFEHNKGEMVLSNPPFSTKKQIIERLIQLDKPFILLLPVSTICYNYAKIMKDKIQIIVPKRRIKFKRFDKDTQKIHPEWEKHTPAFDCLFYCYKMNFPKDINFL
tara:strand:+ start:9934 stop:10434 length:501 start_codon:yes stop_codon:yes gene_type:complete